MNRLIGLCLGILWATTSGVAQTNAPTPGQVREITQKAQQLSKAIRSLKRQGVRDPLLADVEVYHKAAEWTVIHREFFQKETASWTIDALNRGLLRASQQATGSSPWLNVRGRTVIRGYRSKVDDSVQPYAVTYPADYGKDRLKQWRLDIVLHGRNSKLSEVSFLHRNNGEKDAPKDLNHIRLDVYGRGNNAYRWAGESDVLEAVENFLAVEQALRRDDFINSHQIVLRGFSMGGAGAWHLGLHMPGRWSLIGPGAGFTRTHGYVKNLPAKLPTYQEACLHIYDAVDYAENAFNLPVIAYAGSKDKQLQAARNIQEKLKGTKIPMTLLIGEGLAHKFPQEWQKKAEAEYQKVLKEEKEESPDRVRFVTWTMKYPRCKWVEILGLEKHYHRSSVDASRKDDGYVVKTENIRLLHLTVHNDITVSPVTLDIDGQKMFAKAYLTREGKLHLYLEKKEGKWRVVLPQKIMTARLRKLQKITGLQGPIDDAFTSNFLCVYGAGKTWHESTMKYTNLALKRFQYEWSKYMRGKLQIKADTEVTPQDLQSSNLILFGDPSSNSIIAQIMDELPLQWTSKSITLGDKKVDAGSHVPVMIYPSPLNAQRYVVLNSGHTFHESDFKGTNALLFPRLGDFALLKHAPTEMNPLNVEVVKAGLFDDYWRLTK